MRVDGDEFRAWNDAGYPRPQLCRPEWTDLGGTWEFRADPGERGVAEGWFRGGVEFPGAISVPFPPGSGRSGVVVPQDCSVVWYRRALSQRDLNREAGERVIVHFGAVDAVADVWVDGHHVRRHEGGFTPFSCDVTPYLERGERVSLVVRAEDRRDDLARPRGKQDWREVPHGIWYHPTCGIWRDVWLESVPAISVDDISWSADIDAATLTGEVELSGPAPAGSSLAVDVSLGGRELGSVTVAVAGVTAAVVVPLPALANRMDWPDLVWTPERPHLADVSVRLDADGSHDRVVSYAGLRSVSCDARYLRINHAPTYVRGVLDQGYWDDSYLAAPDGDAVRRDLELARDLGFNTVRAHQRTPSGQYLAWADRLGLMVWAEFPAAYRFDSRAVQLATAEWTRVVRRCSSHPSVVAWVPFNESWGVPGVGGDDRQRAFVDGLVSLTRALDPTRPVIANDGWEQLDTDIVTVHDYATDGDALHVAYRDADAVAGTVNGAGPQGRPVLLRRPWADDRPVIVSEFGGVSLERGDDAWGYAVARDDEEFDASVAALFDALYRSPVLAGFCYTQLADTGQETNGLCTADRRPKLPVERLRAIVTGEHDRFASQQRPRIVREVSARPEEG